MKTEIITITDTKQLDHLLASHPETQKKIRKILSTVLRKARARTSRDIKPYLQSDPRKAYQAVKSAVYRQILGGNISILQPRRASRQRVRVFTRSKVSMNPHQRGGNRMKRSQRTEDLNSYYGRDRGFILRFLNAGTDSRVTKTHFATRGRISARNFFAYASQKEMEQMSQEFAELIEAELEKYSS